MGLGGSASGHGGSGGLGEGEGEVVDDAVAGIMGPSGLRCVIPVWNVGWNRVSRLVRLCSGSRPKQVLALGGAP